MLPAESMAFSSRRYDPGGRVSTGSFSVLNDYAVITVAEEYQAHTDWHRKHPALN
jgi:hypothetical protein